MSASGGSMKFRVGSPKPVHHAGPADVITTTLISLMFVGFFAAHQLWSTGFFLPGFGGPVMVLFYASILYMVVTTSARAFRLSEDRALILDLIGAVLWTIASAWLLILFPFNFAHFADVVPGPLQFFLSWITQGLAKMFWTLITVGSLAFIPWDIWRYVVVHRKKSDALEESPSVSSANGVVRA